MWRFNGKWTDEGIRQSRQEKQDVVMAMSL
jgi:hypothetical protein